MYTEEQLREAFEAGREYHSPGYREPMLRWVDYEMWKARMESYMHYGKVLVRRVK